ncbi:hypothetical protein CCP4SC76_5090002 [Gammaproteobacteria bacterium]
MASVISEDTRPYPFVTFTEDYQVQRIRKRVQAQVLTALFTGEAIQPLRLKSLRLMVMNPNETMAYLPNAGLLYEPIQEAGNLDITQALLSGQGYAFAGSQKKTQAIRITLPQTMLISGIEITGLVVRIAATTRPTSS